MMASSPAQKVLKHAQNNRQRYLEGFQQLLRLPSVSTDPSYQEDLERCADWIVEEMGRIGLKNCHKIGTEGHPVLYGEWLEAGPGRPTLLIYAHYDVQPVDPLDQWVSPPFEPTIRDKKLYARGAVDDKCGVWTNLKALESILAVDGRLPVNVKLFFEGEEEMGSPNMLPCVQQNKRLLAADALVLCDGPFTPSKPAMTYALRGLVAAEVIVSGPGRDLHSGAYGGAVHNPIHLVGEIIASFHDDSGRILIPGFYDAVRSLEELELQTAQAAWQETAERWQEAAGVSRLWGESIASPVERATALPTVDVNGVWGGYQGPGMKTVIPAQAGFNATMRLVADQNPVEIGPLFTDHVLGFACDTGRVEVNILAEAWPLTTELDSPIVEAVQRAFQSAVGERPLAVRGGGTIPIGGMFQQELGISIAKFGLGSGDNVHSPNEYVNIDHFYTAIEMAIHFYYHAADTMTAW
jgi:acetylornithine deacetylase/succinyl-diaminopimelate desuccinylase-like protein